MDRMIPDAIKSNWPLIRRSIEMSHPPMLDGAERILNSILDKLLDGDMQCWVEADEASLFSIVVTEIMINIHSGELELLLFSLAGFKELSRQQWFEGYKALTAFAKAIGASRITAFTDEVALVQKIQSFGGTARFYLQLEVK